MTRVLTPLLLELERLNGFGPDGFCSARTDNSNIMWSTAICIVPRDTCLCHLARDLTNSLLAVERLIRFEPDRRRSTQANDGEVVVSIYGCSRNITSHVPYSLTKLPLESKLVGRSRRGKRHSISLYERNTIRSVALRFVLGDIGTNVGVWGSNPG